MPRTITVIIVVLASLLLAYGTARTALENTQVPVLDCDPSDGLYLESCNLDR